MKFIVQWLFVLTILTGIFGCSAPSSKENRENPIDSTSFQVTEWKAVRLSDLPGKPVVISGQTEDKAVTYVQIRSNKETITYKIEDHQEQVTMEEIANDTIAIPDVEPSDLETFVREAQTYLLFSRYVDVWRCRYSSAWRELAYQDIREAGPLLLNIQPLIEYNLSWTWMVGIDQSSFEIVGVSGVKENWRQSESLFVSNSPGHNHLFGLTSEATVSFSAYAYLCSEAYGHEFLNPWLNIISNQPRFIAPEKEHEISKYMDLKAKVLEMDPREKNYSFIYAEKKYLDTELLGSNITLKEINNLIQTARANQGVGL